MVKNNVYIFTLLILASCGSRDSFIRKKYLHLHPIESNNQSSLSVIDSENRKNNLIPTDSVNCDTIYLSNGSIEPGDIYEVKEESFWRLAKLKYKYTRSSDSLSFRGSAKFKKIDSVKWHRENHLYAEWYDENGNFKSIIGEPKISSEKEATKLRQKGNWMIVLGIIVLLLSVVLGVAIGFGGLLVLAYGGAIGLVFLAFGGTIVGLGLHLFSRFIKRGNRNKKLAIAYK